MNIAQIIMHKYPGALESGKVVLAQNLDGPIYISKWDIEGVARPDESELEQEADAMRDEFYAKEFVDSGRILLASLVDSVARSRGYDSGVSCASYERSTNPKWASEASAFIAWRDDVYAYAGNYESSVLDGSKGDYSVLDFEDGLPDIYWPEGV